MSDMPKMPDAMTPTRDEAVRVLEDWLKTRRDYGSNTAEHRQKNEALDLAITALRSGGGDGAGKVSAYGYCPKCGLPGKLRERRLNGDDICMNGHKYPSATALPHPQPARGEAVAWAEGYRMGVSDERTSEAHIGIAGYDAKVEPARQNPYLRAAAQPAEAGKVGVTEADSTEHLRALVDALDKAFISSWQSTAYWQGELDAAREYLSQQPGKEAGYVEQLCRECGHATMHMGDRCFSCTKAKRDTP